MRTIIVGDIHAKTSQFDFLLKKIGFSSESDNLILLGDLIDRGDDAYGTIQRVIELKEKMGLRLTIIRGSHENLLLSSSWKDKILWKAVGGGATVRSFCHNKDDISNYTKWIQNNTVLYYETKHYRCVHAAIRDRPLSEHDGHTLMMNHFSVKRNHYKGKLTITGHIHLQNPTYFDGNNGKGSVLPYEKTLKLPESGVICIDTGCGSKGGKLTGMIVGGTKYRLVSVQ